MLAGPFFQQSFYSGFFDPLKRKLFFKPVRWHARPLNDEWSAAEQHAMHEILRWVKPPDDAVTSGADAALSPGQRILAATANLPLSALRSLAYAWMFRSRIRYHIGRMLRGDRQSFARIAWFARSFIFALDPRSRTFEK